MSTTVKSPLLSREEAASYLGLRPQTLAIWATTGRYNLKYVRIGGRARYRLSDLDSFIASRTVTNTGQVADL